MAKSLSLAVLALIASFALAQQGPPGGPQGGPGGPGGPPGGPGAAPTGPCEAKTTEPAQYCQKGDHVCDKEKVDKDGNCTEHSEPTKKIEMCVRKHYVCPCPGGGCCRDDQPTPGKCKCKKPLKEQVDKCKAIYLCIGCQARAYVKDEVAHDDARHEADPKLKKDVKKTCEKAGMHPHTSPMKK